MALDSPKILHLIENVKHYWFLSHNEKNPNHVAFPDTSKANNTLNCVTL